MAVPVSRRRHRQLDADLERRAKQVRARDDGGWDSIQRLIIDECHPRQRDLVLDPHRRVAALVGRGGGKTTSIRARYLLRMMRTQRARCLYVATTRDQAIDLLWNPIKLLCDRFGWETGRDVLFNETALRFTLKKTKATLRLVGADDKRQIEKYRGQPFHEVWVDEAASYPIKLLEHLIDRIISPRLGDYGGMLGLVGTPGHILRGPFYDATRPSSDLHRPWADRHLPEYKDWLGWSFHHWTLQDGAESVPAMARLWEEALRVKAEKGWSDDNPVWCREYLGQWAADDTERVFKYRAHDDAGQPWNQWDPPRDALGFAKLPDAFTDWEYVYGADLGGASDPFALEVFAFSPSDPSQTLYHVFEFVRREQYAKTVATVLLGNDLSTDAPGGVVGRTGWPIGAVADRDGSGDAFIRELAQVYGFAFEAADKKNYYDSVELTNGDLVDGKMKVLAGSELETQMVHQQWAIEEETGKLKKHKGQRDDCTDAAIYARRKAQHLFAQAAPRKPDMPLARGEWKTDDAPRNEFAEFLDDDNYGDWG